MKTHPSQEQWMEYLYGEMNSPERMSLETHLKTCAPCREKKSEFGGTMESLDAWQVDVREKHSLASGRQRFQTVTKWAAAAALLVTTGFAAARYSQPAVDVAGLQSKITESVKAEIQAPLEKRIEQEMQARLEAEVAERMQEVALRAQSEAMLAAREQMEEVAAQLATLREEDRKRIMNALKTFETQIVAELHKTRQDLERVALYSDHSFRQTQQQLVQLASFSQPEIDTENE
jgi:hypothetical protein